MADNRFVKLTAIQRSILELVQVEGAISDTEIVRNNLVRGQNYRTAKAMLKRLHTLGLLEPIRTCEFKLSNAGQAWLDARLPNHG